MMATTRANFSLSERFALSVSRCVGVVVIGIGYLMTGGAAKVWCGGGDGRGHSRPVAPSQTPADSLSPPRMHLITVYSNSNWVNPKPQVPMLAIIVESANCSVQSGML